MKYYARQVAPEYQESPMDFENWDSTMYPELVLSGNRDYKEHTVPAFDLWRNNWQDAIDHLLAWQEREDAKQYDPEFDEDDFSLWYDTVRDLVEDLFPAQPSRGPYTDQEIEIWMDVIKDQEDCPPSEEYRPLLRALDLMTGGNWMSKTLRGCCQGDWQECYYDMNEYSEDDIRNIEIEYFNLGTEWIVHDEDSIPQHPDDVFGYFCYVYGDDYRRELADIIGCNPEDIVLYKYAGEVRKAVYDIED